MNQDVKALPDPPLPVVMGFEHGDLPVYGHEDETLREYGRQCVESALAELRAEMEHLRSKVAQYSNEAIGEHRRADTAEARLERAEEVLHFVLSRPRGTSGRIILELGDEEPIRAFLGEGK